MWLRFTKTVAMTNEWVGKVIGWATVIMMLAICYDVFMRYVLRQPTAWAHDLSIYLFGILIVMGGGYVLLYRSHIKLDVFYSRFSPRGKAIADVITVVFAFAFVIVLIWQGGELLLMALKFNKTLPGVLGWPLWPFLLALPLGSFLLFLQLIVGLVENLKLAAKGAESKG